MTDDHFLSRWSRRKHAVRKGEPLPEAPAAPAPVAAAPAATPETATPAPLPPVESLTPESDFTPFMRAEVDPGLKREALKTLFQDARFNVMDGLDVYIDDYSKPDPLPEGWLEKMNQVARLGEYREPEPEEEPAEAPSGPAIEGEPRTPQGEAEDVPSDTRAEGPPPSPVAES